jgi:hypothetical protein
MNIAEAVNEAVKKGTCIALPELKEIVKIKPTNGKGNCVVMGADGSHPSEYGWQPTADDLRRTDWITTE